jgi:hypothetical protein
VYCHNHKTVINAFGLSSPSPALASHLCCGEGQNGTTNHQARTDVKMAPQPTSTHYYKNGTPNHQARTDVKMAPPTNKRALL